MKTLLCLCFLWSLIYIDPFDGKVIKRNFGDCPKNGHRTLGITCTDWCRIRLARANYKKGGRISVVGRAGWRKAFTQKEPKCGRKCFCRGVSKKRNAVTCKRHKGKKIKSRQVHFDLRCKKLTKKLKFTVIVMNKDCGCSQNGARNMGCNKRGQCPCKNGYKGKQCNQCIDGYAMLGDGRCENLVKKIELEKGETKILNISCIGPCVVKDITAEFEDGPNIDLFGAEVPFNNIHHQASVYSYVEYFCKGQRYDRPERCVMRSGFSVTKNTIYIMVRNSYEKAAKNVTVHVQIGNFLRFNQYHGDLSVYFESMANGERKAFSVSCDGPCDVKKLYASPHQSVNVDIFGSEIPFNRSSPPNQKVCDNQECFCKGETQKKPEHCVMEVGKRITKETIYIMVHFIHNLPSTSDVEVHYDIRNLEDIKPYNLSAAP